MHADMLTTPIRVVRLPAHTSIPSSPGSPVRPLISAAWPHVAPARLFDSWPPNGTALAATRSLRALPAAPFPHWQHEHVVWAPPGLTIGALG